ncbi:Serine/threonine protein phosphatase PrpC [Thermomonospora echinospora]|uniref:Serine/threonine protein phosphatase PrpC n=1 Tax=Thermomonospora echinospora TaxID=1992 RepID=A0A1H6DWT8_9ACTN|nr:PP2C family serine/threonine-protein phosphatase [Thermomonospora echinospora]SEG89810.1 Serine/threonine protein phosphatase PrpC [Thermomonospora echinospora]
MEPSAAPRCPACAEPVHADDDFCEACGRPLRGAAPPSFQPVPVPPAPALRTPPPGPPPAPQSRPAAAPCAECGGTDISADGYCEQCGLRQPSGREHVEIETAAAVGVSDRGLRHSRNEDAMAVASACGKVVAVVCDGVSSAPRPEDASRVAAETGAAMLTAQLTAGADPREATRAALARAGKAVAALADSPHDAPACTYVSAVVDDTAVTVGWTGDSRAYWISGGDGARPSAALTVDDSWAARMVELGLMTPAEAHADRRAHTVTAWLGADAGAIRPRAETFEPGGSGAVLLCSDGLWNYLPEAAELAEAVHTARARDPRRPPLEIVRTLVRTALEAGGHDNITVVLIPFPPSRAEAADRVPHGEARS